MRSKLVIAALLFAALGFNKNASADTLDDFTITGNGLTITFSLPASTLAYVQTPHSYWYETFPEVVNGVSQTGSLNIAIDYAGPCTPTEPSSFAGIRACTFYSNGLYTLGAFQPAPGLYNAYVPLTFNPGVYPVTDYLDPVGSCSYMGNPSCTYPQYTITVTPESTPAATTPEPGTLALFSTGLASAFALRQRFRIR